MIAKSSIAIIVPSFNEKRNISALIKKIFVISPKFNVYIVDDNSPDKTQDVVRKLIKRNPNLELFVRNSKSGRGGAVLEGFKMATLNPKIKYFIEMDADLSHSPNELGRLLNKVKENTIVVGSRYVEGSRIVNWPFYRRFLSKFAQFLY